MKASDFCRSYALLAVLLCAAAAVSKPDRPPPKEKPPAIDLNYETQYGTMRHQGLAVTIEGPLWAAAGTLRDDGSIFLLWTEQRTGRIAPSVYRIKDGVMIGLWGWATEVRIEKGEIAGDCHGERLYRIEPPADILFRAEERRGG